MRLQLSAPEPLASDHLLNKFNCGEPCLDDWLKKCALVNQASDTSHTFVVVDQHQRICGY